ncbi:MAG: T9SS type A sorting domain-containing protein [Bacteroidia bacterium]|nr:T9SS type A sorting domain-containing protein [Bacteroidia bacterium]MCX7651979.1 T9SS type A sorting domain-containing protein [Bacteroidia bacterium]MDW8417586.1 T9SS type A sorting domain-containing protein [Bacteroidia bacterium]
MRNLIVTAVIALEASFSGIASAQSFRRDTDTVIMGAGYRNMVFYQLQTGRQDTAARCGWHLAFEVPIRGAAIRVNHPCGVTLYKTTRDTSQWAVLSLSDTVTALYDDLCKWERGAFNTTAGPSAFDVGWGIYNLSDHITRGDSLYIIRVGNTFKKFWIQRLEGSSYFIRIANLDGSQDTAYAVSKTIASGKNFVYLNLLTHQVYSIEPDPAQWDLVFTQYAKFISPPNNPSTPVLYNLTGVLINQKVKAARVRLSRQANPDTITISAYPLDSCISIIGDDWKSFVSGQWILADTLYFLVQDRAGRLWRVRFIDFGGSATGRVVLEKALIQSASTGLDMALTERFLVYPNPVREGFSVSLPSAFSGDVELYALTGERLLFLAANGEETVYVPRPVGLGPGFYILRIRSGTKTASQAVIFE